MHIHSKLQKTEFLSTMKAHMSSYFHIGEERCTAFALGPLICVTYHSGWRWIQRLANKDSTAIGIVRSNASGCDVHYFITSGMLRPSQFLLSLCLCSILWLVPLYQSGNWTTDTALYSIPFSIAATFVFALIEAAVESLHKRHQKGKKILTSILQDPSDPVGYLDHLNER